MSASTRRALVQAINRAKDALKIYQRASVGTTFDPNVASLHNATVALLQAAEGHLKNEKGRPGASLASPAQPAQKTE